MNPDLSVVIPIYNESDNLEPLYRELVDTLERWGRPFEILFVDDGSSDGSSERLDALQQHDQRVIVIHFRKNFGQTAAFAAGFAEARGSLIVTCDGDGQNDPRDIPAMVAKVEAGADIVCGWRRDRKDPWLSRRLPSGIANRLISVVTGVHLNDYGCSLKVFRSEVVKPLRLYGELHRFLPALASETGVRIEEMPVNHRPRTRGRSKYGITRTLRVVLDLITVKFLLSYSTRPLQVFGLVGLLMGALGVLALAYLVFVKFVQGHDIGNRPMLLAGVLLVVTGVQLITLGLLAEMQARAYREAQGRPVYAIRNIRRSL